jgi:hypothetical protein
MRLLLGLFGLLCVGLVLMLFKDVGWLATPHPVSIAIAAVCVVLAVIGLVTTGLQVLEHAEPPPKGTHTRRPPVRDEPLP